MNKTDTINILFCGIGGQGVLKASEICASAALFDGFHVKKSEVHGMAQRGGSVESHLRFGTEVFSPLIPKGQADYLVSFYKEEQGRLKDFLNSKSIDLIDYLAKGENLIKDKRYINIFLLGVLSKYLDIKEDSWLKAIEKLLPLKYLEENKKVFAEGRKMVPRPPK
ncbi:MAG: indolepyruvate oxidoreductase subunit beta [Candidatus Omnitrophica bacterium]|nr:indolepyruvate oxidoreductase subunit beta [Candidatus Omnitrophota bacterium]